MDSTIEVTQRLDRLSIATNLPSLTLNEASASPGPSRRNMIQPFVSPETSTQAPTPRQSPVQTATAGITTQGSDNDVTMGDDLITATRNLSIRSNHLQNRRALEAHGRGHAEWSRLCTQRRHGTVSIAMISLRSRQRQAAQALPRPQPRPRSRPRPGPGPSRQAREDVEAGSFFRHCAQIQSRRTVRAYYHHHQRPRTPPITTSGSEAAGLTREEHHRNLFRAQLRVRQQIRLVSAIAAGAGY